jgi:hypothetical protein
MAKKPTLKLLSRKKFKKELQTLYGERLIIKGNLLYLLEKIYTDDYHGCDDDLFHIYAKKYSDLAIALLRIELSFSVYTRDCILAGLAPDSVETLYHREPEKTDPAGWQAWAIFNYIDECAPTYKVFIEALPIIIEQVKSGAKNIIIHIPQE